MWQDKDSLLSFPLADVLTEEEVTAEVAAEVAEEVMVTEIATMTGIAMETAVALVVTGMPDTFRF